MTTTDRRPLRRAVLFGAIALLALLGWRALSLGMADHYAENQPARALSWRSDHPEALVRRAEQLVRRKESADEAAELARRAVRANPLDGRPHRILGQLAAADGKRDAAAEHFLHAARLSPRDVATQGWLVDYHLARNEYPEGMQSLDRLMRGQPGLARRLTPALVALAEQPKAHPALAAKLAEQPPWRAGVMAVLIRQTPNTDLLSLLVDRVRQTPDGLSKQELTAWVDRLGKEGRWGAAYLTWVNQLPKERLERLGNVYNGSFEWEPGQGGFDWRFGKVAGARIERLPEPGASGERALRVAFEDRRVPFSHVSQLMALAPGRYRLTGQTKIENLRSERGLVWSINCVTSGARLGDSQPIRGQSAWRPFSLEFEIPSQDCGGQWVTLRLPARIPAEQRIGGAVWFDDIRVRRED